MIYLSIALVILSTQYFGYKVWEKRLDQKDPVNPNQDLIERLNALEDKVSNLQIAKGIRH